MKTYSRKKGTEPEEEIIELSDICRLCMGKEDELVAIFNNEEPVPLTLRIMACVALEVFEGDGLPDKICHPCKFQLEKSYSFRKKCESSDQKLRQHLSELREKLGEVEELDQEIDEDSQESCSQDGMDETITEADLVGTTKVTYTQHPDDEEEPAGASGITLPPADDRDACTLPPEELKEEPEEDETDEEEPSSAEGGASVDDASMSVIADAVKATLASQPGFNMNGQLQLKVNQAAGKSTQVEVTTEDGHVIVMEIMTEDGMDSPLRNSGEINEDGELKIFQCPDCPKSFARRIQLRRHASVHMQQRGFSCGICEKWFPTRSALIRHERIHTGERPFQCEVCPKSFAQKEILFRHLMTHTGQKPYNCPHCPKGFTQKEQLRVHIKSHATENQADIQLHYCSLCPKVFCHASGLSRHLVTHTGKTFKCRDCDKHFSDKSSLRRHHLQTGHQL